MINKRLNKSIGELLSFSYTLRKIEQIITIFRKKKSYLRNETVEYLFKYSVGKIPK